MMSRKQRPTSMIVPSTSTSGGGDEQQQTPTPSQGLPRRMLARAANLLTTKGDPVPAVAETILELEHSDSGTSRSDKETNFRWKTDPSLLTRRKSEGSHKHLNGTGGLNFEGIRRKLVLVKDVSVGKVKDTVSASVVRTKSLTSRRRRASTTDKNIQELITPVTPGTAVLNSNHSQPSSTPQPQPHRAHIRSYSDVLSIRPRVQLPSSSDFQFTQLDTIHSPEPIEDQPISPPSTERFKMADFAVPPLIKVGTPMMKVSAKKQKKYMFRLDSDQGQIVWESKRLRISAFFQCFHSFETIQGLTPCLVSSLQSQSKPSKSCDQVSTLDTTASNSNSLKSTKTNGSPSST